MSELSILNGIADAIWVTSAPGGGRKWSDVSPPLAAHKAAQDLARLLAAANGVGGRTPLTLLLERTEPGYDDKLFGRSVGLRCMGAKEPATRHWDLNWVKFHAEVIHGELVWEGEALPQQGESFAAGDFPPQPNHRLDRETVRQLRLLRQEAGNIMSYQEASQLTRKIDKALETGNVDPATAEWLT